MRGREIGKDGSEGGESVLLNDAWPPKGGKGGWGVSLRIYGEKQHDVSVRKERRVRNDGKQD